jgi:hypothetical protein
VVKIDSGDVHVVVARADGSVAAWGWNHAGQCNVPVGLQDVVDVAAGWGHSVALRRDGSVVQWGSNQYQQLKNLPAANVRIADVEVGYFHSVAVLADCNLDGLGDYGQIASGQLPDANANGVPDGCECASNLGLPACCVGNLNGDTAVDGADLGILLNAWGPCAASCAADLVRDGFVNGADLGALLGNWGACP